MCVASGESYYYDAGHIPLARGANLKKRDLLWAPLGEGGLILVVAAIGWATKQPLIFASLGPTAYELVEQPQLRSARPYNIVVGHLVGIACGFFALFVLKAWAEPSILSSGIVSPQRLWAVTVAATLTTLFTLLLKAGQPAALATTLLIALGLMQTRRDALAIVVGVLIVTGIGAPLRRLRLERSNASPT
jgi:HPP family